MSLRAGILRFVSKLGFPRLGIRVSSEPAHLKLGHAGERLAERFLRRQGYRIVTRNYVCPAGEIDLVALDGRTVVFVEVKTRRDDQAAFPEDAVTPVKRAGIGRGPFLPAPDGFREPRCRCDIVAITWPPGNGPAAIEHFQEAFLPTDH